MSTLYESWLMQAYDKHGQTIPTCWNKYLPKEQKIYEELISQNRTSISGTLEDLAKKYQMPPEHFIGFLDGINEALNNSYDTDTLKDLTLDSNIDVSFTFENLYKKMVEFRADHLYNLEQWNAVFTPQQQEELYTEQKNSGTVRKDPTPGRNDPCKCQSGKKYKKCCGA